MFKPKYLVLSLLIGALFTLLIFALLEHGIAPRSAGVLLSPGLLVPRLVGSSLHDLQNYYLIGVGDACLYGGIAFFLMTLLNGKLGQRNDK
jgi:hypothetical protein